MSKSEATTEIMTDRAIPTSLNTCLLIRLDYITHEEVTHLIHTRQIGTIIKQQVRKLTQKKHSRKANYEEGNFRP